MRPQLSRQRSRRHAASRRDPSLDSHPSHECAPAGHAASIVQQVVESASAPAGRSNLGAQQRQEPTEGQPPSVGPPDPKPTLEGAPRCLEAAPSFVGNIFGGGSDDGGSGKAGSCAADKAAVDTTELATATKHVTIDVIEAAAADPSTIPSQSLPAPSAALPPASPAAAVGTAKASSGGSSSSGSGDTTIYRSARELLHRHKAGSSSSRLAASRSPLAGSRWQRAVARVAQEQMDQQLRPSASISAAVSDAVSSSASSAARAMEASAKAAGPSDGGGQGRARDEEMGTHPRVGDALRDYRFGTRSHLVVQGLAALPAARHVPAGRLARALHLPACLHDLPGRGDLATGRGPERHRRAWMVTAHRELALRSQGSLGLLNVIGDR